MVVLTSRSLPLQSDQDTVLLSSIGILDLTIDRRSDKSWFGLLGRHRDLSSRQTQSASSPQDTRKRSTPANARKRHIARSERVPAVSVQVTRILLRERSVRRQRRPLPDGPRMTRKNRRRPSNDEGTILLLTLGCVAVALMLVVVVVDASAVFLARRSLASEADGAAVAAAQSVSKAQIYANGAGTRLPLADVQAAVARYAAGDPGLDAAVEHGPDGDTVVVTAHRGVNLPLVGFLGAGRVTVTATSRATSVRLAP